jgi:hypothetical protein
MPKHVISTAVRLVPVVLWIGVAGVGLWYFFRLQTSEASDRTLIDSVFPYGFLVVTIYGLVNAYRELKSLRSALLADRPILPSAPKRGLASSAASIRFPLSEPLRVKLREAIRALEQAGVLLNGEVSVEDAIDCAEVYDDLADIELYEVMRILQSLRERRAIPFSRLAFFPTQMETREDDIVEMVREMARLAGQADRLRAVTVKSMDDGQLVFASEGEFPSPNAKIEFELDGQLSVVAFVMYAKNLPIGLFDELAKVFIRKVPSKRFVSAYCDLLVIAIIDNENVTILERFFPDAFEPYASQ